CIESEESAEDAARDAAARVGREQGGEDADQGQNLDDRLGADESNGVAGIVGISMPTQQRQIPKRRMIVFASSTPAAEIDRIGLDRIERPAPIRKERREENRRHRREDKGRNRQGMPP